MANITVTIGPNTQGTNLQDQGFWIKKDINAYDLFVSQIGRPPSTDDVVKFVIEHNICVIGTLANLSGIIDEPNYWGEGTYKVNEKPLSSMGALTFDNRWSGLNPKIYLDNYGIIMGKGGDALPTIFAPGSTDRYNVIAWGYDWLYGLKSWGNTGIKVGDGVMATTDFGVYVRNFGIIAGGGGAGCSVTYEHPPQEVNESMCAGGGGGVPYGKGARYQTRPEWNGSDASLFIGGNGFNRGTIRYYDVTYETAGGNGGAWGQKGQETLNTHPNAGSMGMFYRPYQSPTSGLNDTGYYSEGNVYINNHFDNGVEGILAGRVLQRLTWDENDLPGEVIDRKKVLTAFIRGTGVNASRVFNYKEQIDPEIDTFVLDITETQFFTYNVLQKIREKYGDPVRKFIVNLKVWDNVYVVGSTNSVTTPAIDFDNMPFDATINIDNRGFILGRGGDGMWDDGNINVYPQIYRFINAQDGGPAFRVGVGCVVNVNNYGLIAGGGGGGGGAGDNDSPGCVSGGGGAPFGAGRRNQLNQPSTHPTNATLTDMGIGGKLRIFGNNWWYGGNGGTAGENGGAGNTGNGNWRNPGLAGYIAVGNTQYLHINNVGSGITKGRI